MKSCPDTQIEQEYKLFLLRLWRESSQEDWRVSIQSNLQSKQTGLPTLQDIITFLECELSPPCPETLCEVVVDGREYQVSHL